MKVNDVLDICMCSQRVRIVDISRCKVQGFFAGTVLEAVTSHKELLSREVSLMALRGDVLELHTKSQYHI